MIEPIKVIEEIKDFVIVVGRNHESGQSEASEVLEKLLNLHQWVEGYVKLQPFVYLVKTKKYHCDAEVFDHAPEHSLNEFYQTYVAAIRPFINHEVHLFFVESENWADNVNNRHLIAHV
ncbi:hypothetical protein [Enterovibrio calviensis]|uniref:hypothetical protein n=1 Tax=Enterovibrio calviensis TaxID=91359 RepID=UPI000483E6CB|nr:hypothetical protein [Enterovibrio calviensis]